MLVSAKLQPPAPRSAEPAVVQPGAAPARRATLELTLVLRVALALLVVGNLGRLPGLAAEGRDAPILFNDLMVGGYLVLAAAAVLPRRRLEVDPLGLAALAFAGVGLAAAVATIQRDDLTAPDAIISLAYLARWLFYFAIYVAVVNTARAAHAEGVWRTLETATVAFAAFGVVQAAFLPNFAQLVYPDARVYLDWDPQEHRLVSTFLDPNYAGALLLMVLLVQVARLSTGAPTARWRFALLLMALLLTLSRSSILAFGVGGLVIMGVHGVSRRVLRWAAGGAVLVAASLPFMLDLARSYNKLHLDASAMSRVVMWLRGLEVFADHPLFGIGFNTWGPVQDLYGWPRTGVASYAIEGGLLFVAVLTGVVGLTVFCTMLWLAFRRARLVWRDPGHTAEARALALGAGAITVALPVHSLFTNSLLHPFLMEVTWVLWGLVFLIERRR